LASTGTLTAAGQTDHHVRPRGRLLAVARDVKLLRVVDVLGQPRRLDDVS
jgi:hypothetical protein